MLEDFDIKVSSRLHQTNQIHSLSQSDGHLTSSRSSLQYAHYFACWCFMYTTQLQFTGKLGGLMPSSMAQSGTNRIPPRAFKSSSVSLETLHDIVIMMSQPQACCKGMFFNYFPR